MDWKIIGHQWAVDLLAEHVRSGRPRHAYLITGPSGVGRRTLGVRLAQALACTQPPAPGQPCLECSACRRLERLQHPDLSVIEAESVGGTLKVEQIRELQHSLALAPYEARYRIALLKRFEEAHDSAQNALLKTLEEPAPQVILILTAESAESVLPTIVSRCEVLRLRPTGVELLRQQLEQRGVAPEPAGLIAHLSGGCPGLALKFHEDKELLDQRNAWVDDIWRLTGASRLERFAYPPLKPNSDIEKETLLEILTVWLSFWHDVLLCASGSQAPLTNLGWNVEIHTLARQVTPQGAYGVIQSLEKSIQRLKRNINTRLTFEVFLLDLPLLRLQ